MRSRQVRLCLLSGPRFEHESSETFLKKIFVLSESRLYRKDNKMKAKKQSFFLLELNWLTCSGVKMDH